MTTVYQPNDTIISPVIAALAQIIKNQVAGVSTVYEQPPDGPPEDGSVLLPLANFKVLDDTNGRLKIQLTIATRHFIRRGSWSENVLAAYSYFVPYIQAFAQWSNQDLGGLAQEINLSNGGVTQYVQAGQVFCALLININVVLLFNIPTN